MSFHYESWVIVWFSFDHFWFSPTAHPMYHIMIFTNSWKSRLPSPSLSAALINIITSSSVSTSPVGWLLASKTKSSWKGNGKDNDRYKNKDRNNKKHKDKDRKKDKDKCWPMWCESWGVWTQRSPQCRCHLCPGRGTSESPCCHRGEFFCMDAILLVIFLTGFASMLYRYRQASQKSWSLKWQHFSPLLYHRRRSSCGSSCYRTQETRSDPSHPCRTAGEVENEVSSKCITSKVMSFFPHPFSYMHLRVFSNFVYGGWSANIFNVWTGYLISQFWHDIEHIWPSL